MKYIIHTKKIGLLIFLGCVYKRQDICRYIYYLKNYLLYEDKKKQISNKFYNFFYGLPYIRDKVKVEVIKFNDEMKNELINKHKPFDKIVKPYISEKGLNNDEIMNILQKLKNTGNNPNLNYVSGAIYNHNENEIDLMKQILPYFFKSNPLHPDLFPQVSFLEKNIIKCVAKLFNGNEDVNGCITSGGTESIICACYAYKVLGLKKGITNPEIIAPISIHAAFDKASNYFGIKIHKIPIELDNKLNFNILESYINNNTILLACSAPSYAHGLIDDIEKFSNIAVKYNIPLHVDACLGGFLLPFLDNLNIKYDFELPGVTSISADTHKYGYTPKGSSILLYKNENYYKNQIFVQSEWNGGIYATPTIPGSRPGNNIVFTWAFLNYYGINKYKENSLKIVSALDYIKENIKKIKELKIIGNPILNVIGIKSDVLNVYCLNQEMKKYGWELNELQNPSSIHFCITLNNVEQHVVEKFCKDLKTCVDSCKDKPFSDSGKSVYGSTQKIKNERIVSELAKEFIKNLSN